ncbi:type IV pilin protein [Oribacterium sp. FC2011]|uniref:type IV pilin protein n=1 Tax=Oribacterium sp. FC2011 TaxID=1408311 RepID=UPI0005D2D0B6|nr:prepilin-type N-terminal cleavage/methylation domain-containing protein [Oribacterium sp. FC2011]
MFKKINKKGFTLAELLIVVAIIGVLVAISIPIFTSQLEKAREATDLANLRSLYAETTAYVLTEDVGDHASAIKDVTITIAKDATTKVVTGTATYTCTQQKTGLEGVAGDGTIDIGGASVSASKFGPGSTITITVKSDGSAATFT